MCHQTPVDNPESRHQAPTRCVTRLQTRSVDNWLAGAWALTIDEAATRGAPPAYLWPSPTVSERPRFYGVDENCYPGRVSCFAFPDCQNLPARGAKSASFPASRLALPKSLGPKTLGGISACGRRSIRDVGARSSQARGGPNAATGIQGRAFLGGERRAVDTEARYHVVPLGTAAANFRFRN